MTTWFTSDEHFGHRNIIEFCGRPFKDLEDMHRSLIERHNAVVKPGDEVIHVGDFSLDERLVPKILPRLNGRHKLVVGNHDKPHPCHRKSEGAKRRYLLYGFETVCVELRVRRFKVCHLPFFVDDGKERKVRYLEHRPKDDGAFLLHGHVHGAWVHRVSRRMINVGVDAWHFRPVQIEALEAIAFEGQSVFEEDEE